MANENQNETHQDCVASCDEKFIECVERSQSECLVQFDDCSISCEM